MVLKYKTNSTLPCKQQSGKNTHTCTHRTRVYRLSKPRSPSSDLKVISVVISDKGPQKAIPVVSLEAVLDLGVTKHLQHVCGGDA